MEHHKSPYFFSLMVMELTTLKKAYDIVKNHPFRVERIGSPTDYGDVFIKLGNEFYDVLAKQYYKGDPPKELYRIIIHEIAGLGCHFRSYGLGIRLARRPRKWFDKKISRDMLIGERYINQIHAFLDTEVFEEWDWYYFGDYGTGWQRAVYNKEKHSFDW